MESSAQHIQNSPNEFHVVGLIRPKAGKIDIVQQLISEYANWVRENEPKTYKFQLFRQLNHGNNLQELVLMERFSDEAAFQAHLATENFKASVKPLLEEDLLENPFRTVTLEPVGGFPERNQAAGANQ